MRFVAAEITIVLALIATLWVLALLSPTCGPGKVAKLANSFDELTSPLECIPAEK